MGSNPTPIIFAFGFLFSHARVAEKNKIGTSWAAFEQCIADVAQLGERQTEDLKVPGSIPGVGIAFYFAHMRKRSANFFFSSNERVNKTRCVCSQKTKRCASTRDRTEDLVVNSHSLYQRSSGGEGGNKTRLTCLTHAPARKKTEQC